MNDLAQHITGPVGFIIAFLILVFAILTILMPYYVFVCAREMIRTRKLINELLAVMRTRR